MNKKRKGNIMELKNDLQDLLLRLRNLLENAPEEEECTDEQNDMYSDMANLVESIENYLEVE